MYLLFMGHAVGVGAENKPHDPTSAWNVFLSVGSVLTQIVICTYAGHAQHLIVHNIP